MNPITNLHQDQNKVIVSMGYDNITTNITLTEGYGTTFPGPSLWKEFEVRRIPDNEHAERMFLTRS